MTAKAPEWLDRATARLGVREIVGKLHSAIILGWLKTLGAWWKEDETPWCGAFVAVNLKESGIATPASWYRAKDWATWGSRLSPERLAPGAILVFGRDGGGHVGFYVGEGVVRLNDVMTPAYRVLGGNQGNRVCYAWLAKSRLIASRWPVGRPVIGRAVQLAANGEQLSANEA